MAGYVLSSPPASASAKDEFTVPTLTCPGGGIDVFGAFVFAPNGSKTGAGLVGFCDGPNHTPSWSATLFYDGGGQSFPFNSDAGDTIVAKVSESASGGEISLRDVTLGKARNIATPGAVNASLLVGMANDNESSSPPAPILPFSNVTFSSITIDKTSVSRAGAQACNMVNSSGVLQVMAGPLNSTGNGFTDYFKHL
jgi:hypothetical protein